MKLHPLSQTVGFTRWSVAAAVAASLASSALATEYDLSPSGSQSLDVIGAFGGTAVIADTWVQPTGTGVFNPFLTLDANGKTSTGSNSIESAFNADGFNQLYLDGLRPNWNTTLKFGDLALLRLPATPVLISRSFWMRTSRETTRASFQ